MKLIATSKAEQNRALADPWTVVHFGVGLALGLMGINRTTAILGAAAYELVELGVESTEVGQRVFKTSGPEHYANAALDVLVFGLAYELGQRWNQT